MTDASMPQVSVLVPMFNAARTLERAIDSALTGQGVALEVIAIDDMSHDDTCARVKACYGDDPRVRLLRLDRNLGPSGARNAGLAAARGEWIALLDADDMWLPGRLGTLLTHADQGDLIADDLLAYDAVADRVMGRYFKGAMPEGAISLTAVMEPNPAFDLGFLKPLMRRSLLETHGLHYHDGLRHGEDLLLYGDALCYGGRMIGLAHAGYVYTIPNARAPGAIPPAERSSRQADALSAALRELGRDHAASLTPRQRRAVARRASYFSYIDDYIDCVRALRRLRPMAALTALLRQPRMLSYAWRVLRFRLSALGMNR